MQRQRQREQQDAMTTRSAGKWSRTRGREPGHQMHGTKDQRRGRATFAPLLVGLALTLAMVLIAPAAPASADTPPYTQPYGRYRVFIGNAGGLPDCLTALWGPGADVLRTECTGTEFADKLWFFNRVGTYWGDPVFEIRSTLRIEDNGRFADCLDVPYGNVYAGQPLWTWPCNGGNAQRWRQMPTGTTSGGNPLYRYVSMSAPDSGWVIQANNNDPHLVMVPASWSPYQMFFQSYFGP
jgi:hypothetical protein